MAGSDDLMQGLHDLEEARPDYDKAWEYWRSEAPESFDSPVWRRLLAKSSGRYRVNIAKIPIVALADRLKVSGVVAVTVDGALDEEADPVLQERVWAANKLLLQNKRLIRNALIYGDVYRFVWPGDEDGSCRVHYNSPTTTRAVYDDDDELTIRYVVRRFVKDGQTTATLLYPDRLERGWVLKEGADPEEPKSWDRPIPDDREARALMDVPHDYGRVPVFHFRTDLPFGVPEHEDAWGAQDAYNKLTATLAHVAERAGLPDRYLLAEPNAALNGMGVDNPDWDDDGDADETTRDNTRVRTGPGEVSVFEGIKAAGEWGAAQPAGFTGPADWFAAEMAKVTRTPSRYADPGGQHPSGAALRAADAPLDAKTEDRQDYLTDELEAEAAFALKVCGLDDRRVSVRWKPAGIVDDVDTWQIVAAKVAAGVPQQVALTETGLYDPDTVGQWMQDAEVEMDVTRRVRVLADFAGAVAQLGQGVSLGLIDEAAARQVVDTTLGQLTPQVEGDVPA